VYVPSPPTAVQALCRGIPHAIVLRDLTGEYSILVPVTARPLRPATKNELFSSTVLLDRRSKEWAQQMRLNNSSSGGSSSTGSSSSGSGGGDARHFLYPVHGSLAFVFTPSLASSLFLLLMRFMNRQVCMLFLPCNDLALCSSVVLWRNALLCCAILNDI